MTHLDWKFILYLSLFGLAMAIATVFWIPAPPAPVKPLCWVLIFLICAYLIAKHVSEKHFRYGFMTALFNCVWITGVHLLLFDSYSVHHAQEMAMMAQMPMAISLKLWVLITGPIVGVVSGLVLGGISWGMGKVVKKAE